MQNADFILYVLVKEKKKQRRIPPEMFGLGLYIATDAFFDRYAILKPRKMTILARTTSAINIEINCKLPTVKLLKI